MPHLIKTTHNNVQAHKLRIGGSAVDWEHIEKLYKSTPKVRAARTKKPLSNMKVSRATQVLSASVCVALMALVYANELPADAMATASFCDRMDKLFDALEAALQE